MRSLLGYCADSTDFLRIVQESGRCFGLIELHLDLLIIPQELINFLQRRCQPLLQSRYAEV